MVRLNNVCKKFLELKAISGKNDKKAFLEANEDDEDFKTLLRYRYDIFKTYKIKSMGQIAYALEENRTLTFEEYIELLDELNDNNINASLRKKVEDTLSRGNYLHAEILEGIVTKGLSLGVDTTVTKFLNLPSVDCMLASPIKENTNIPMPCIVELKYDGVRCIAMVEDDICKLYTRQGRQLHFPQLEKEFIELAGGEDLTFDCELETDARTGISGICNSNLKKGYVQGSDDFIKAFLFDEIPTKIFKEKGKTLIQKDRTLNLQTRMANFTNKRLWLGASQTVSTLSKLQEINKNYINDGFEGVIVKDPNAVYHYKRNTAWLKLKAINSATFKVVGVEYGKGKREGKVGALICESSCGWAKVKVGSGFTDDDVETFTKTEPIGKFLEVLFNVLIKGRDSDTYSCFLPRYKEMRIDKDEADSLKKIKSEHIGKVEE